MHDIFVVIIIQFVVYAMQTANLPIADAISAHFFFFFESNSQMDKTYLKFEMVQRTYQQRQNRMCTLR